MFFFFFWSASSLATSSHSFSSNLGGAPASRESHTFCPPSTLIPLWCEQQPLWSSTIMPSTQRPSQRQVGESVPSLHMRPSRGSVGVFGSFLSNSFSRSLQSFLTPSLISSLPGSGAVKGLQKNAGASLTTC